MCPSVTEKHVYRRLKLASLHQDILDALAGDEINLSLAACFTISDDEEHSLKVLDHVRGNDFSEHQLKRMLKPDVAKPTDRRAIFVGRDAYLEAGGRITNDLFTEQSLFDDPETLQSCFVTALETAARELQSGEGWSWVEAIELPYFSSFDMNVEKFGRVYREEGILTKDEEARLDELQKQVEDPSLDDAQFDDIHREIEALEAIVEGDYTTEQKAVSGAYVYVDNNGSLRVAAGFIKPEQKADAIKAGVLQGSNHGSSQKKEKSPFSQTLVDDMNRVQTGATQHAMLRDPELLLDLLAYQLSHDLSYKAPLSINTPSVPNSPTTGKEGYTLDTRLTDNPPRDMWDARDLGASFRAFRKKGPDHVRAELMRFLAAQYTGGDDKLGELARKATKPNVREVWTPTAANFFSRVGAKYLYALWIELLDLAPDHPSATTFDKLKKGDKANKLDALFNDKDTRSALNLTPAQEERIAAWVPEILS